MINMLYKLVGLAFVVLSTSALSTDTMKNPSNHFDGKHFFNQPAEPAMASPWKIWWYFFTAPRVARPLPNPCPCKPWIG